MKGVPGGEPEPCVRVLRKTADRPAEGGEWGGSPPDRRRVAIQPVRSCQPERPAQFGGHVQHQASGRVLVARQFRGVVPPHEQGVGRGGPEGLFRTDPGKADALGARPGGRPALAIKLNHDALPLRNGFRECHDAAQRILTRLAKELEGCSFVESVLLPQGIRRELARG